MIFESYFQNARRSTHNNNTSCDECKYNFNAKEVNGGLNKISESNQDNHEVGIQFEFIREGEKKFLRQSSTQVNCRLSNPYDLIQVTYRDLPTGWCQRFEIPT